MQSFYLVFLISACHFFNDCGDNGVHSDVLCSLWSVAAPYLPF